MFYRMVSPWGLQPAGASLETDLAVIWMLAGRARGSEHLVDAVTLIETHDFEQFVPPDNAHAPAGRQQRYVLP